MKAFVVVLAIVAAAHAKPQFIYNAGLSGFPFGGVQYRTAGFPLTYTTATHPALTYSAGHFTYGAAPIIAPAFTKTQYHAQDELGQASYGYSYPGQSHAAVRDAFGGVRGSYAYIGADGKEVRANYVADALNGFRVESNVLPVAPAIPEAPLLVGPSDTPEVVEARAAHFKAIEEAKTRNAEADQKDAEDEKNEANEAPKPEQLSRRKRGIFAAPALTYSSPIVYSNVLGAPQIAYSAVPSVHYSSSVIHATSPGLTYAAAPGLTYAAAPGLTYAAAPGLTYAASPVVAHPLREATLTKVVNTPGHAVSYRVD